MVLHFDHFEGLLGVFWLWHVEIPVHAQLTKPRRRNIPLPSQNPSHISPWFFWCQKSKHDPLWTEGMADFLFQFLAYSPPQKCTEFCHLAKFSFENTWRERGPQTPNLANPLLVRESPNFCVILLYVWLCLSVCVCVCVCMCICFVFFFNTGMNLGNSNLEDLKRAKVQNWAPPFFRREKWLQLRGKRGFYKLLPTVVPQVLRFCVLLGFDLARKKQAKQGKIRVSVSCDPRFCLKTVLIVLVLLVLETRGIVRGLAPAYLCPAFSCIKRHFLGAPRNKKGGSIFTYNWSFFAYSWASLLTVPLSAENSLINLVRRRLAN